MIVQYSGTQVGAAGGYWVDRHGHRVFLCEGKLLPACPLFPFMTTAWRLAQAQGCPRPALAES